MASDREIQKIGAYYVQAVVMAGRACHDDEQTFNDGWQYGVMQCLRWLGVGEGKVRDLDRRARHLVDANCPEGAGGTCLEDSQVEGLVLAWFTGYGGE